MSTIGLTPIRMREATLAIGADDYTTSVNQAIFTPQNDYIWSDDLMSAPGTQRPYLTKTRWHLSIGFAQDFTTAGALSLYLLEHTGQQKTGTLSVPGRVIAFTALILPAQLGGVANQIPAAVVTMPLYGTPETGEVPHAED